MNEDHATAASALPVTDSTALHKARKPRQSLTAEQYITAADMLAAGHLRHDVATHFNIGNSSFYRHVTPAIVDEAKARRAQRIADGLEVLPEVVRETVRRTRTEKPVREKIAKVARPRGEALMKMSEAQRIEAADMLAAGHRRQAVADHFAVTPATTYKRVTVADVIAAKARRKQRIADGLEVLPEVARTYKGKPVKVPAARIAGISKAERLAERTADKQCNKARKDAIKAHDKLKTKRDKELKRIDAQYLELSERVVALRASIATLEGEMATVRQQRRLTELSVPALDLSAFEKPAPKPVDAAVVVTLLAPPATERPALPAGSAATALKPAAVVSRTFKSADEELPVARAVLVESTAQLVQHNIVSRPLPAGVVARPNVPEGADLLLVPLTAASNTPLFRQQHQPPLGWTPSELWNGFVAINGNLHNAHKTAAATDPLIDKLMLRFAIQRYTADRIEAEGDDFIREHRAEKLPGHVREVFLLVSHKKHKVLGEVWQDRKAGSVTPQTVFVLDPLLAEQPKLENLMVLLPEPTGKGQKYSSFTPTRSSRSPD